MHADCWEGERVARGRREGMRWEVSEWIEGIVCCMVGVSESQCLDSYLQHTYTKIIKKCASEVMLLLRLSS